MTKEEILNSIDQFLTINGNDSRLVVSLEKSIKNLFEKNSIKVPFESLSLSELKEKLERLTDIQKNSTNKLARESAKNLLIKVEERIKVLS